MSFLYFLKITKKRWKNFYNFLLLFIIGTLICAFIIGQSITPFFVFQMYSQKIPKSDFFDSYKLVINGEVFNTYQLTKEKGDVLRTNLQRYLFLSDNDFKDKYYTKLKEKTGNLIPDIIYSKILDFKNPSKKRAFEQWIIYFIEMNTSICVKNAKIYKIIFVFDKGIPVVKNQILKFNILK